MSRDRRQEVKEIVVISGKGGTGKTSFAASLIPLLPGTVLADCDVDAPDLHILLHPEIRSVTPYHGARKAVCYAQVCMGCDACVTACEFHAIDPGPIFHRSGCEGCGTCTVVCPVGAVNMESVSIGDLMVSDTYYGPFIHARLIPGEEASGKLVTMVRTQAREIALSTTPDDRTPMVLCDGSPGIGCQVIASLSGASAAIIVTEPSLSGFHDMRRVWEVAVQLSVPVIVVINKSTLAPAITSEIEEFCEMQAIPIGMRIPFEPRIPGAIERLEIPSIAEPELFRGLGLHDFVQQLLDMIGVKAIVQSVSSAVIP